MPCWGIFHVGTVYAFFRIRRKPCKKTRSKRPALPEKIAPANVFLASEYNSSYITEVILAETGGLPIN